MRARFSTTTSKRVSERPGRPHRCIPHGRHILSPTPLRGLRTRTRWARVLLGEERRERLEGKGDARDGGGLSGARGAENANKHPRVPRDGRSGPPEQKAGRPRPYLGALPAGWKGWKAGSDPLSPANPEEGGLGSYYLPVNGLGARGGGGGRCRSAFPALAEQAALRRSGGGSTLERERGGGPSGARDGWGARAGEGRGAHTHTHTRPGAREAQPPAGLEPGPREGRSHLSRPHTLTM